MRFNLRKSFVGFGLFLILGCFTEVFALVEGSVIQRKNLLEAWRSESFNKVAYSYYLHSWEFKFKLDYLKSLSSSNDTVKFRILLLETLLNQFNQSRKDLFEGVTESRQMDKMIRAHNGVTSLLRLNTVTLNNYVISGNKAKNLGVTYEEFFKPLHTPGSNHIEKDEIDTLMEYSRSKSIVDLAFGLFEYQADEGNNNRQELDLFLKIESDIINIIFVIDSIQLLVAGDKQDDPRLLDSFAKFEKIETVKKIIDLRYSGY